MDAGKCPPSAWSIPGHRRSRQTVLISAQIQYEAPQENAGEVAFVYLRPSVVVEFRKPLINVSD